jgi:acetyl esterase/lipase
LHKPSLLWPPPSEDFTSQVHAHLRKFADGLMWDHGSEKEAPRSFQAETPTHKQDNSRADPQFQFYVENRLLRHPLVSPALSYLGGLPPLFFVAGDGEVLRAEIVYT